MRLINCNSLRIEEFYDNDIPPYAILSHTWGKDEVSYQQMASLQSVEHMLGYTKIKGSCEQAQRDKIAWAWVDTCCIDKRNSAELSEAINSMFSWYKNAQVCYTYFSDVFIVVDQTQQRKQITKSRWFTRGWTLQELLAPSHIIFYSNDWQSLGTKAELSDLLSEITNIDMDILHGLDLHFASVSKKMSWASSRETSRIEDIAYCLLGIFNVNMPLLYGEQNKAFHRLQEEILKASYDASLFAWGIPNNILTMDKFMETIRQPKLHDSSPNNEFLGRPLLRGPFAISPAEFANSGNIAPLHYSWFTHDCQPPIISNRGIRLDLPLAQRSFESYGCRAVAQWKVSASDDLNGSRDGHVTFHPAGVTLSELAYIGKAYIFVVLSCRFHSEHTRLLGLVLRPWGKFFFGRLEEPILLNSEEAPSMNRRFGDATFQLEIAPERVLRPMHDQDFRLREVNLEKIGYRLLKVDCIPSVSYKASNKIVKVDKNSDGPQAAFIFEDATKKEAFVVIVGLDLGKQQAEQAWIDCVLLTEDQTSDWVKGVSFKMWNITTDPSLRSKKWECLLKEKDKKVLARVESVDSYQGPYHNEIDVMVLE